MHQNAGKKTSKKCLVGDPPPKYVPPPHAQNAAHALVNGAPCDSASEGQRRMPHKLQEDQKQGAGRRGAERLCGPRPPDRGE